jgi:predicted ester cyclase
MPDSRTNTADHELVGAWLKLWNGDYSQADHLIASDFRMHAAMLDGGDGSALKGPQGLVGWITQTRAAIPDLQFSVQVGPIIEGDRIAVRWSAQGIYQGGFPGAAAPPGTAVAFTGADFLRVKDGRLVEYWVNSDTLLLVTQLRVGAG